MRRCAERRHGHDHVASIGACARRARGSRRRRLLLLAPWAASVALCASAAANAGPGRASLEVVARNLNNPRKIFVAPDGALYVVEAGTGGRSRCLGTGPRATCVGLTGAIARIAGGAAHTVVSGLASFAFPDGHFAEGVSDVRLRDGRFYVLLGDTDINSIGANDLGPDGATAGDLISTPAGRATPTVIVSLAAFEAANNPDHGAGPGPKFGDPSIDSNPYAFTAYRGGFAVADAAANDLLWISPSGDVTVLAVFPTQTERLTPALDRKLGAPTTMTSLTVQSVPTSVVVGPDGALYVGELTGVPYEPGRARIWRVSADKKRSLYASGFTNISDLAFDGNDLLVLEMAVNGLFAPSSPGALIRLAPGGGRTELASVGLVDPTGLAVVGRSIYISNDGTSPGSGPGPHGELVRLALSASR